MLLCGGEGGISAANLHTSKLLFGVKSRYRRITVVLYIVQKLLRRHGAGKQVARVLHEGALGQFQFQAVGSAAMPACCQAVFCRQASLVVAPLLFGMRQGAIGGL